MRVGIQTITWGRKTDRLWRDCPRLREIGYEGVEIFQHPELLGSPDELYKSLSESGLELLGLSGGSFAERVKFLGEYVAQMPRRDPNGCPYIYVDRWEEDRCPSALKKKLTLAVHPHMFKKPQTIAEAEELLETHTALRFLPDTAHLTVAGEDVLGGIKRLYRRIDAIHLKDWNAEVGRAYQFYSRGFTELGNGDVDLDSILRFLKDEKKEKHARYDGWLVIEQEAASAPFESARKSRDWLSQNHGI